MVNDPLPENCKITKVKNTAQYKAISPKIRDAKCFLNPFNPFNQAECAWTVLGLSSGALARK
jgi:hypothetical protein